MATKMIVSGKTAREKIIAGTNKLADAVCTTLGPKGGNVALGRFFTDPVVVHDGVSVAKEIELEDKFEDVAAQLIRQAAAKTNDRVGDGTTSSTLLTQVMVNDGMELVATGINPMSLKRGMELAKDVIVEKIRQSTIPVETKEKIQQVATISSQNPEMGKLIADAVWAVGKNGTVDVQESSKYGIEFEIKEGMEFDKGLTSPRFANTDKGTAELDNVRILLIDHPVQSAEKLVGFLAKILEAEKQPFSILIMADSLDPHSLESLLTNKKNGSLYPLFIQSPGFASRRKEYLQDIASLVGATVVARDLGMNLDNISLDVLGRAEKVISDEKNTKIVGGLGTKEAIALRVSQVEKQIANADSEYDKKVHQERIAKLSAGCAVMKVGGLTEVEMKDNRERIYDAVEATKAAFQSGIVYGGGRLLWEISDYLDDAQAPEVAEEVLAGYYLVTEALRSPFRKLMDNSGFSHKVDCQPGWGIDAETGEKVDLLERGIIDPAEVVINTIQNSISVAAMLLTTTVIIVDKENAEQRQNKLGL